MTYYDYFYYIQRGASCWSSYPFFLRGSRRVARAGADSLTSGLRVVLPQWPTAAYAASPATSAPISAVRLTAASALSTAPLATSASVW